MKKYHCFFLMMEHFDFDKAERSASSGTHPLCVPATEENMQKYHHLNKSYWQKRLERGDHERAGVKPAI